MALQPISWYAHELKPSLDAAAFAPARSRLLWIPVHLAIIAAGAIALASGAVPWALAPLLSLVIGVSFSGLVFLAHETLHGGVVRGRRLQYAVGFLGFLPFVVSPRFWMAWHNRVHHGHTSELGVDPDAYPTLAEYQASRTVRVVTDYFSLGGGRLTGLFSLILGFTGQSLQVLVQGRRLARLSPREHRLALAETALGISVWATLGLVIGLVPFLFAFALPLLVANVMVMMFILTNHGLSPLTDVNDPLANSLTVTVPKWLDVITLRFGLHVEHHIFPSMSSRQAPQVTRLLRARWGEQYQSMPLWRALLALSGSARVYKTAATLVDPRTGREFRTLGTPVPAPVTVASASVPAPVPVLLPVR